ncbi:MAG: hypothetical protein V1859_02235 [archaeon]
MLKISLEIPQWLTDGETKDSFSFRSFEETLIALGLGIFSLVLLIKLPFGFKYNLIISAALFVGIFETYRYVSANYYKWKLLSNSYHNVSFFDSKMNDYLNIREIKNKVIFFKDNTMMSILRVKSIDGSLLGDDEINSVIETYGAAIKSIPHTIFVFSHSVEPSLNSFFASTDEKIIKKGGDYEENIKRNKETQKWLIEKMKESDCRDRISYFGVLCKKKTVSMSFSDSLAFLFNIKGFHEVNKESKTEAFRERQISDMNIIIENAALAIDKTGATAHVLNDDELIGLYSYYFLNIKGVGKSNLSPFMWLEE